jgi:hypothetical protein
MNDSARQLFALAGRQRSARVHMGKRSHGHNNRTVGRFGVRRLSIGPSVLAAAPSPEQSDAMNLYATGVEGYGGIGTADREDFRDDLLKTPLVRLRIGPRSLLAVI